MCKGVNNGEYEVVDIIEKKPSGRTDVVVDKCMANLIKALNELGFETQGCCCGHGHIGYLQLKFNDKIHNVMVTRDSISIEFGSKK